MNSNFKDLLKEESNSELHAFTENGAVGFQTSGKCLVNLNFKISSYRNKDEKEIEKDFERAFAENALYAIKFLFFASDVRQGLGERRFFRVCLNWLEKNNHGDLVERLLDLIPEYSRWDNILCLIGTSLESKVISLIKSQIDTDLQKIFSDEHKPISLLGKWLPSVNTSSKATRNLARKISSKLGYSEKEYRQILSKLRKRIGIVESSMSSKSWGEIKFETVPSKANIKYAEAFLRNDEERRKVFLESLKKGETKINSSVNFPHEIVHAIRRTANKDTFEELWKNLPNYIQNNNESIITVVDSSGSMRCQVSGSISAEEVARGIGIYFAEHLHGEFKDKIITFSENPTYIDLSNCKSLDSKVSFMENYFEIANTDIQKVFMLILNTAKKHHLYQKDLPNKILIISDMEFDEVSTKDVDNTLFEQIKKDYEDSGYSLPGLVFWNINSRNCVIPLQKNDNGLTLVSGFSPSVISMILSGKLEPFDILLEKLNSERYEEVGNRVKEILK